MYEKKDYPWNIVLGCMITTFAFAVAFASGAINGIVCTTIKITIQYLVISKIYRNFVFEIIAWHFEAKSSQKEDN